MIRRGIGLGSAAALAMLALTGLMAPGSAQAVVCNAAFGPAGSGPLQGVLNGITQGGPSSVNVSTDCVGDAGDSLWQIGGSGGSIATLIVEIAGFAGSNSFGIWDATSPATTAQIFSGPDFAGGPPGVSQHTVSILADGSVFVDLADTGVDFAGNKFGFYLDATIGNGSAAGFFYSDTSLNADGLDHMFAYEGKGDTIQIAPFSAGPWASNEFILAWEDLVGPCTPLGGADCDYTDFVVLVESVSPIPEPGSLAVAGIGLIGLTLAARRRRARR